MGACASSSRVGVVPIDSASPNTLEKKIAILRGSLFDRLLKDEELSTFASFFVIQSFPPSTVICREGTNLDSFYVIGEGNVNMELPSVDNSTKGSISRPGLGNPKASTSQTKSKTSIISNPRADMGKSSVSSNSTTRSTTVLCAKKPGEFFGEALLGDDGNQVIKNSTSAVTIDSVTVAVLTKAQFTKYRKQHPDLIQILESVGASMEKSLASIDFLKGVPGDKIKLMVSMFKYVPLHKDDVLYHENDFDREAGNSLYFLQQGKVKVTSTITDKEGTRTVQLNELTQGQFFGEVGLMMDIPRTATITAVETCMLLELSQKNFRNFIVYVPDILAKFNDKMLEYNINLRYFIHNPIVLESFIKHCKSEYSTENIEFWMTCKEFRKIPNTVPHAHNNHVVNSELIAKANEIKKQYIGDSAASQVNLKGRVESELLQRFTNNEYTNTMFVDAEEEILNLMSRDSFGRFKNSELFKTCLETVNSPYTEILRRLYLL